MFSLLRFSTVCLLISLTGAARSKPGYKDQIPMTFSNSSSKQEEEEADEEDEEDEEDEGRIMNGVESALDAWPFMAALLVLENGTRQLKCGGTIWNEDTIITAAHCLVEYDTAENKTTPRYPTRHLSVYLGHTDLSLLRESYLFQVHTFTIHPQYNGKWHDIALLKFEGRIDFKGKHSKARCLCNPEPLPSLNTSACLTMGWGRTKSSPSGEQLPPVTKLRQVVKPLAMEGLECASSPIYYHEYHICAGGYVPADGDVLYKYLGPCVGDSGGPLVCPHKHHPQVFVQVGVTSFTDEFCERIPVIFTRLSYYETWIEEASVESPSAGKYFLTGTFLLLALVGVAVFVWLTFYHKNNVPAEETAKGLLNTVRPPTSSKSSTPTEKQETNPLSGSKSLSLSVTSPTEKLPDNLEPIIKRV